MLYLQQYLSRAGITSRRKAVELIKSGQIKVNGQVAKVCQEIDPDKDSVLFKGRSIKAKKYVYYLVHKPIGYTCSTKDKYAQKLVIDLVPPSPKVWIVGRLDKNSRGLVILTNDGEFTQKLTHPSFQHEKEYLVILNKNIQTSLLSKLTQGVKLQEGVAKVDKIKQLTKRQINLTIHQGWYRQIRRMMKKCGYGVVDLLRIRIADYKLGELKVGQYKQLKNLS